MSTNAKSLLKIWSIRLSLYEEGHVSPHPSVAQAARQLVERLRQLPPEEPIGIDSISKPLHAKFIKEKTGEVIAEIKEKPFHPSQLEIEQLSGLHWRLWHYTASHDRLTAEIFSEVNKPSYISFMFCEQIQAPTHCSIQEPSLRAEGNDLLLFQATGIRIICMEVVLHSDLP